MVMVGVGLCGACVGGEGRFERNEAEYRDEMRLAYPPGSRWIEPADTFEFERWRVSDPAPDAFAARALEWIRSRDGREVAACEHGDVLRRTFGSSVGAVGGLWTDYVFLDSEDRVVVAFRRFVD